MKLFIRRSKRRRRHVEPLLRAAPIAFFMLVAITACASPARFAAQEKIAPDKEFVVFDSMRQPNKPATLGSLGMQKITALFGDSWTSADLDRVTIDETLIASSVRRKAAGAATAFLDVENRPLLRVPADQVQANVDALAQIARTVRAAEPSLRFGFYSVLPARAYREIVRNDKQALARWREANRAAEAIAAHVDFVFPSLYTFSNDPQQWEMFAEAMLEEARRYKRPVYAFLWPEFHDANPVLRGKAIPAEFWRRQLEFCRRHADGIVIWGSKRSTWDENAPWWRETLEFLREVRESEDR